MNTPPSILSLSVRPEYRKLGLGRKLLTTACESLKKQYDEVLLTVRPSNPVAHNLYLSMGFVNSQRLLNYYQASEKLSTIVEDGIRMVKKLK